MSRKLNSIQLDIRKCYECTQFMPYMKVLIFLMWLCAYMDMKIITVQSCNSSAHFNIIWNSCSLP